MEWVCDATHPPDGPPKALTTRVRVILAPHQSTSRPIRSTPKAAIREPVVYRPDTRFLDQPVSWIMGSTKTAIVYVCPGAEAKIQSQETVRMTHP
jgi:hypothetical protein